MGHTYRMGGQSVLDEWVIECENEDVSLYVSGVVASGFSCVFPGWFLLLAVALLAILFLPEYDLCVVL